MVRIITALILIVTALNVQALGRNGVFTQLSGETGTYQVHGDRNRNPALGLDVRLGAHSTAWRDFYRYVGFGSSMYKLDSPNDDDLDHEDFNTHSSNTYVNVFAFGGIALNSAVSPFIEVGLNGAEWLNGNYVDEGRTGQNGFFKAGLDIKSRSGGWIQLFYKASTTQDVGPLRKMVTTGITGGWAF